MKQKSKVRENSEYAKVPVFQCFFLLERLLLMDARAAINGIQEVSGSIPLISTTKKRGQKPSFFVLLRSKDEPQTSCNIINPPLADGRREMLS